MVAAKFISLAGMKDDQKVKQMLEINIMAQLNHPYITKMLDHFESDKDEEFVVVMELCDSGELLNMLESHMMQRSPDGKILRNERPIDEKIIRKFIYQISSALAYLHKQNKIHRDLKPENIFVH